MQNLKTKQKGITLIALIITIIVMLILVGVTINVVLTGGLFTKAEEAKKGTQIASEKEQLLNAIFGTLDNNGKIHLDKIILPDGFIEVSEDNSKIIYEGSSTNQYEVDKVTGKIEEKNENNTINEEEVLGLYGKKEYVAVELLENGKCTVYREGITLDGEYNNGVATAGGMTINYTIELIKDEQSGEVINKMMYFEYEGDMIFLTTQELDGLDTESYNNKHYVANHYSYQDYYFQEGFYVSSIGSLAEYNYFVYQNWIWSYDQIIKGVEGIYKDVSMEAKINPDGTFTRFEDGREIIYTYKGQTFEKN